eukprot:Rmarinus@m.7768
MLSKCICYILILCTLAFGTNAKPTGVSYALVNNTLTNYTATFVACEHYIEHLLDTIWDFEPPLGASCTSLYTGRVSRTCCDSFIPWQSHECMVVARFFFSDPLTGMYGDEPLSFTQSILSFFDVLADRCGAFLWRGYDVEACGNGVVEEWEQCDDGNDEANDGCTSCFTDAGYDCFVPATSTDGTCSSLSEGAGSTSCSVCWPCARECDTVYREPCAAPNAECGPCVEGYSEGYDGECHARKHVYYSAVGRPGFGDGSGEECTYHDVGPALAPGPSPSAVDYLSLVHEWSPSRTGLVNPGRCNINGAVHHAPAGEDVVLVLEIFDAEVFVNHTLVCGGLSVVVFAAGPRSVVNAGGTQMFDVCTNSSLFLYNVDLSGAREGKGGVSRNYGTTVIESSTLRNNDVSSWTSVRPYNESMSPTHGCLLFSVGWLELRDVVMSSNHESPSEWVASQGICRSMISANSISNFSNVTFFNNSCEKDFISVFSPAVNFVDLTWERNTVATSLIRSEAYLSVSGLYAIENSGTAGSVFAIGGTAFVNNFLFKDNVARDDRGTILNRGRLWLESGDVVGTSRGVSDTGEREGGAGGSVRNEYILIMQNSTFSENAVGGLYNNGLVAIVADCLFVDNTAVDGYSHIFSTEYLAVDGSTFSSPSSSNAVSISSTTPFILRDSIVPDAEDVNFASCGDPISSVGAYTATPCGRGATCTESDLDGVHCSCTSGVGSATYACGTLVMLPSLTVTKFMTKDGNTTVFTDSQEVLLFGDTRAHTSWEIDSSSVPPWLSLSPTNGSFIPSAVCEDTGQVLTATFDIEDITASSVALSDGVLVAPVHFNANYLYFDPYTSTPTEGSEIIEMIVTLEVEVLPSANSSLFFHVSPCEGGATVCDVEAGSEVVLRLELFDVTGFSLGIGGSNPKVDISQSTTIGVQDHRDGSYEFIFDAPDLSFEVTAFVLGSPVGDTLSFTTYCPDSKERDAVSGQCEDEVLSFSLPKELFMGALFCVFAVTVCFPILKKKGNVIERAMDSVYRESALALAAVFCELIDLGTDIGAAASVLLDPELDSYYPYYVGALTIAGPCSVAFLFLRIRDWRLMSRLTSEASAPPGSMPRANEVLPFAHPQRVCAGGNIHVFHSRREVQNAILMLRLRFRRSLFSIGGLVVEDFPMQILNAVLLCSSSSNAPFMIIISTQVTCVFMGVKLAQTRKCFQIRKQIERIQAKTYAVLKGGDERSG